MLELAAPLEHQRLESALAQFLGGNAAAHAGADDDCIKHGCFSAQNIAQRRPQGRVSGVIGERWLPGARRMLVA